MSETSQDGFATKESFAACGHGKRRWQEFDCPGVGRVWLGSLTAGPVARLDAGPTRAALAGHGSKPNDHKDQVRALNDGCVELVTAVVHDGVKNPMFGPDDRALILSLDTCI